MADKSLKKKLSPKVSHRKHMKSLVGNKLLAKLKKTPKIQIGRDLAQQFVGDGSQPDQESHLKEVIENM